MKNVSVARDASDSILPAVELFVIIEISRLQPRPCLLYQLSLCGVLNILLSLQ